MHKIILLLTFYLLSTIISTANDFTFLRLNMKDDYQSHQFNKLDFGVHSLATTGLDTSLGEKELPPFIPPDGLHGVFLIDDLKIGYNLWSYINLMPIPKSKKDSVVFRFEVHNIVQALTLSWLTLPSNVDSAIIKDRYTGDLIRISMKDSLSARISNKSITKFEIIIWLDISVGIEQNKDNDNSHLLISPNPFTEWININSDFTFTEYNIYSELGNILLKGKIDNNSININLKMLSNGVYYIKLRKQNGEVIIRKIVKI